MRVNVAVMKARAAERFADGIGGGLRRVFSRSRDGLPEAVAARRCNRGRAAGWFGEGWLGDRSRRSTRSRDGVSRPMAPDNGETAILNE